MLRACVVCGVPTSLKGSRCQAHQKTTTTQRGYGTEHQKARERLKRQLPALCAYGCGTMLTPDKFVAAHVRDGRPEYGWVAACAPCNEKAKAR